ncbi:MAG: twin-arginine translocation signal domain-containing protein [Planctomycetaceae bacterium]|jgi:hypothetical protein|nr:twin-arginine translocation signal domain-containing protein [Planctomycetaceae bacterium]
MSPNINRRDFVKASALGASMAGAVGMPMLVNAAAAQEQKPITAKQQIASGTIAGLTIGRMLLGGNLLTHYTHSRDLRYVYNLAAHYNTPEKIFQTMRIAEAHGINAVVIHTAKGVVDGMKEYKKQGGKIQWIICPTAPINEEMAEYTQSCQECIDAGVDALYLWGVQSDALINKPHLIKKAVMTMKSFGVPVGVAAHKLEAIEVCEREKVKCDFYLKTFHHHNYPSAKLNHDSSWCDDPNKVIEVMAKVEKPWIAYKIMAAGAIPPKNALEYAFVNGADFAIFGMFDYEIDEDTRLLNEVLALDKVKNRARKWFG